MKKDYQNDEFLQKRRQRQIKLRKRRLKIFFTLFVILMLVSGVVLSLTVLFPIKNITAKGSKVYTSEEILKYSGIAVEDNLFTVSEKEALANLKAKLPFVASVEFERTLPDTLNIKVTDAKEYACYEIDGKYFTVSQEGWVLSSGDEKGKNVILIKCNNVECEVGTAVKFTDDFSHELAQKVIDSLTDMKIEVNYVDITQTTAIKAKVENRFIVNFGTLVDLEPKVKHLDSMMEEIGENKTGNINLNMWNSQNTQGTFVQTDIK